MNNRKVTYAAIDIGSNAVRLLIKSIEPGCDAPTFVKEQLLRVPLRLGEDTFSKGEISREKGKNLLRLIKAYKQLMRIYNVKRYRACATSAMRDAANGCELVKEISRKTGINIEIIDGNVEARLIYDTHIEALLDRDKNYIYVDVGGGSTEISLISGGELRSSRSYNIGTVRLLEGTVSDDTVQRLRRDMQRFADSYPNLYIIGSGGNINKLYRLADKKDKKLQRMPIASLQELYDQLSPLTPEQRMKEFSLKADRADVIVPAARIFLTIAETVKAQYVHVPVIGLADGIIDSLYSSNNLPE